MVTKSSMNLAILLLPILVVISPLIDAIKE